MTQHSDGAPSPDGWGGEASPADAPAGSPREAPAGSVPQAPAGSPREAPAGSVPQAPAAPAPAAPDQAWRGGSDPYAPPGGYGAAAPAGGQAPVSYGAPAAYGGYGGEAADASPGGYATPAGYGGPAESGYGGPAESGYGGPAGYGGGPGYGQVPPPPGYPQPTYPRPTLGSPQRGPEYIPGAGGATSPSGPNYAPPGTALQVTTSRRRWGPLVALALGAALIGGGAGAAVTAAMDDTSTSSPAPVFTQGTDTPVDGRPNSVTSIAKKVLPSVVTVNVRGNGGSGNGSGVIITSDGYILTNNHVAAVAADGGSIRVDFYNGKEGVSASIVGRDPKSDLAVLKVSGLSNLPAATLGKSSSLQVGDPVIAIGAPLDLSSTVTTGIVSALNRDVTVPGENGGRNVIIGAIQTDAAINPGNSGGALVDGLGQVVGINTAIATGEGSNGSIGLGFAIPIDYAKSIADEIIRTGHATHPYIGVTASTVTADEAQANGGSQGAQVQTVVPGGPAADGGLRRGDVITKVNDTTIQNVNDLIAATRLHKVGDVVRVTYERDGQSHTVDVTLEEAPSE